MKKLFSVFLALLFLVPAVSLADEWDDFQNTLDAQSLEYLMAVNACVQKAIFKQALIGPDGVLVPVGEDYVVGVDIPAGAYRLEYAGSGTTFSVCYTEVPGDPYSVDGFFLTEDSPVLAKLVLTDGLHVSVRGGPIRFYTYTGIFN